MITLMSDCLCTNVKSHLADNGFGNMHMTEVQVVDNLIEYTNNLEKRYDALFSENKENKQANFDYEKANDSLTKRISGLVHERDAVMVTNNVLVAVNKEHLKKIKLYESFIPVGEIVNNYVMRSTGVAELSRTGFDRRSPNNVDTRPIHEECDSMGVKFACRADRRFSVRRKEDRE